ncbi:oocyte zinc finger protein XlCOF7.1-like [Scylla paramamosain]|uniref:oocyte zinc finger protein XlCOF7.1-like n=1 Tax=Scylla paramamosain TaxID=85552 RepID=UPI003083B30A
MALSETWVQFVMAATLPCSTDQASIQAAALPGTDGCLASPRVPAGLDAACAGGSGAAVEVVRPGTSMSGRRWRQQQQQQQQQPASGVGRHRHGGKNHLEADSSVHRGESKFECQQCDKTFVSRHGLKYHTLTHSGVRNYECDLAAACAGGSGAVVEVVRPGSSMSGRWQQQQSASGVGRRRCGGKNHLEAGSSVHRGESKFECQQCDKTFVSRQGLKYHTLTHSGVRNYECDTLA